ncbi:MAG: hypothetical protein AABX14_01210 [Candidatus Aenigmatarchaeota archaeon]
MLDEKESAQRVSEYLRNGTIAKEKEVEFVSFFLNNAKNSLGAANLLWNTSTDKALQKTLQIEGFNGYLWVINASYYSMFYMARALLESTGIKMKQKKFVHEVTYHCLVHYFYTTKKLQKIFVDDFEEAGRETAELLGQQRAAELMEEYHNEKKKRGNITYETGIVALQQTAKTSLERARRFYGETGKITRR